MAELGHDQIDKLLGAYALEALSPEQMGEVEAHHQSCAPHRQTAMALRVILRDVRSNLEERKPSPHLRDRILDAIRREHASSGASRGPGWPLPATIASLIAAVLLAFLGGIAVDRLAAKPPPRPAQPAQLAWIFAGNAHAPCAVASLTYFRDRKTAVLAATGLPALQAGKLYEIWLIRNGTPIEAGTSGVADGKLVVTMTRDLTHYQGVAITTEPGEQSDPTGSTILEGHLTSASP
ncbi:MAG: anti-sigma factor [Actinomycetota bacterium]|nr:anti-sigma factor [Actinomycetota bacterium]